MKFELLRKGWTPSSKSNSGLDLLFKHITLGDHLCQVCIQLMINDLLKRFLCLLSSNKYGFV